MGTIKDRNGRDLTEAEDIKKQEYKILARIYRRTTKKKKILMTQITTMV